MISIKLTLLLECDPITCALVKDASSGSDLVIQKYEAYSAYVNLNNFFYTIYNELFQASESSAIASSEIVNVSKVLARQNLN